MLQIAIMGMGGREWIAGIQYLQSLVFGNTLLPKTEQAALHLYLDPEWHRLSDYLDAPITSANLQATNFAPEFSRGFYSNFRKMARIVLQKRRWPAFPTSTLRQLLKQNSADVLFAGPHFEPGIELPQICWIPDFQHVYRPEFFSTEERERRDKRFAEMIAKAARVIVSNQCSYNDAVRLYPDVSHKLAVLPFTMYLGGTWRESHPAAVLSRYKIPDKFLLFPGQFWKHKNHDTVFRAIKLMRDQGVRDVILICTGYPHDPRFPEYAQQLTDFIRAHALEGAIRVLGLIPRPDQVQLMRAAAAIVQPSFFEGWSAVLEECRSLGKRVFASDIPMHREQEGERVHLFDPSSAEELANLICRYWPDLRPGPQAARENEAEAEYLCRIREFARQFVILCRRVTVAKASA